MHAFKKIVKFRGCSETLRQPGEGVGVSQIVSNRVIFTIGFDSKGGRGGGEVSDFLK